MRVKASERTYAPPLAPAPIAYGRRCRIEGAYASSELVLSEEEREGAVCVCVRARVYARACILRECATGRGREREKGMEAE